MPVKLGSRLPGADEARIEIIPLIDIMFFLLAAFMLVSLSMVNLKSVKVNLPTATTAAPDTKKDFLSVSVDRTGLMFLEGNPLGINELGTVIGAAAKTNAALRVLISADEDARHGNVIRALDMIRSAGVERVAFEIKGGASVDVPASQPKTAQSSATL